MNMKKTVSLALVLAAGTAVGSAATQMASSGAPQKATPAALKQDMRKLWSEHVIWTRNYIVAAAADAPDQAAAAGRLMKNQADIGAAVAVYYGTSAGDTLTALLTQHISIAVDLIKAAKTGDKPAQQQADTKWQQNGVDIADFLSKANPHWPRATLVELMRTHLSTTTAEVVARLSKDWAADVRAFDEVYRHVLMMSDALADGIVKQFPDKFMIH